MSSKLVVLQYVAGSEKFVTIINTPLCLFPSYFTWLCVRLREDSIGT